MSAYEFFVPVAALVVAVVGAVVLNLMGGRL